MMALKCKSILINDNSFRGGKMFKLYYHSFSRPNVCLARLQMELCSPLKSKVSILGFVEIFGL